MDKVVVYFHGYGSSANTDKVGRLREALPDCDVYAFPIDVDPRVSLPSLEHEINMILATDIHRGVRIVFAGTSLGAWYASKLAAAYGVPAVLVNPCYEPSEMLAKYGVPEDVLAQYDSMVFSDVNFHFISENDEVIDFQPVMEELRKCSAEFYGEATHRFNGPEFDDVVDCVRHLM